MYSGPKFAIDAIEAGKNAAVSLHRFVQPGTSMTIGRNRRQFVELDKDNIVIDSYDTADERANIFAVPTTSEAECSSQCSVSDTMPYSY